MAGRLAPRGTIMEWDFGAGVVAVLLSALAVPCMLLGARLFHRARSHAGRAIAVAAGIFGLTLLASIVAIMILKLSGAVAMAVWSLFQAN